MIEIKTLDKTIIERQKEKLNQRGKAKDMNMSGICIKVFLLLFLVPYPMYLICSLQHSLQES